MAINDPADLFLYELSGQYDAEVKSALLLGEIAGQVVDGQLTQLLRVEEQGTQQKLRNLDACFEQLSSTPADVPCASVDGMRAEFRMFMGQDPPSDVLEMYALGATLKLSHFGVASYRGLVDRAMLMGESQCAQILQTNLVQKEESAGRLERISHDMSQRVLSIV